jgi:Holliday junction resolvase
VAATPESKVKAKIRKWLEARGIWYCMPIGTGYGNSGVPDFVCCNEGTFLAIEAKAPGKRGNTTILQDKQIMAIHKAGGAAVVIDDVAQLDTIFGEVP